MRDDFTKPTKNALALRANFKCSFTDCGMPTSGPNDSSPDGVTKIGVAAHIHGASPLGPRYLSSMSSDERKNFKNGIWLCPTHSTLIDQDTTKYTADFLREMKAAHENKIQSEMSGLKKSNIDLIALGPDMVFSGELIGIKSDAWQVRILHFIVGDLHTLITFAERYEQIDPYDRYILVNSLGDGRQLSGAPEISKSGSDYVVCTKVRNSLPRINAHNLPRDFALNDGHDLFVENGNIAVVSGLDALPQRIKSALSLQRGESPSHRNVGARIIEYFYLFRDSTWLSNLIKLEVIRNACIPYLDPIQNKEYTLLQSINRVNNIEILDTESKPNWVPFHFDLIVEGIGSWKRDISIFMPIGDEFPNYPLGTKTEAK
ncbi:MAG: hypothetical protein HKM00_08545 [Gallionella sp.]|nr:hypothetical protein [Gallionella sp.]